MERTPGRRTRRRSIVAEGAGRLRAGASTGWGRPAGIAKRLRRDRLVFGFQGPRRYTSPVAADAARVGGEQCAGSDARHIDAAIVTSSYRADEGHENDNKKGRNPFGFRPAWPSSRRERLRAGLPCGIFDGTGTSTQNHGRVVAHAVSGVRGTFESRIHPGKPWQSLGVRRTESP